jgi:hypothetical protein
MDEIESVCSEFTSAWIDAFRVVGRNFDDYNRKLHRIAKKLRKDIKRLSCYLRGGKRPRYYHTGIEPKRQNTTRKKQRLTRLQRRAKRQK